MTVLEFLNRFILQWFFIRLTRVVSTSPHLWKVTECEEVEFGLTVKAETTHVKNYRWIAVMYWVKPITGWGTDNPYEYIHGKQKLFRITKIKTTIHERVITTPD